VQHRAHATDYTASPKPKRSTRCTCTVSTTRFATPPNAHCCCPALAVACSTRLTLSRSRHRLVNEQSCLLLLPQPAKADVLPALYRLLLLPCASRCQPLPHQRRIRVRAAQHAPLEPCCCFQASATAAAVALAGPASSGVSQAARQCGAQRRLRGWPGRATDGALGSRCTHDNGGVSGMQTMR
jgi:hypothetical protein